MRNVNSRTGWRGQYSSLSFSNNYVFFFSLPLFTLNTVEEESENMAYEQNHDYVSGAARKSAFQRLRWCQDKFENKEDWQSDSDSSDFETADKEDRAGDE